MDKIRFFELESLVNTTLKNSNFHEMLIDKIKEFSISDLFTKSEIKDYINANFHPDDIFDDFDLKEWAHNSSMFEVDEIKDNFTPDQVFNTSELNEWAKANGLVEDQN